ncbi:MAG TPA: hypothetical protein VK524_24710 [Polyangiaceae bacterium]|nr:hypothetical protein [Polyangiaceae bacterium]
MHSPIDCAPGDAFVVGFRHADEQAAYGAVGLEVTIYNPALDADGSAGRALTGALVEGLTTREPSELRALASP